MIDYSRYKNHKMIKTAWLEMLASKEWERCPYYPWTDFEVFHCDVFSKIKPETPHIGIDSQYGHVFCPETAIGLTDEQYTDICGGAILNR